jgi:ribosome-binding factor A
MTSEGRRTQRVAELLKAELVHALQTKLGDPELAELVVSEVTLSEDLSVARVTVRCLTGEDDEQRRRRVLSRLGRAQGRLRHLIGPRLRLRRTPELRFAYDRGQDAMHRVQELLEEIAREEKSLE